MDTLTCLPPPTWGWTILGVGAAVRQSQTLFQQRPAAAPRQRVVAAFHSFRPVLAANESGRSCPGGDNRNAWKLKVLAQFCCRSFDTS